MSTRARAKLIFRTLSTGPHLIAMPLRLTLKRCIPWPLPARPYLPGMLGFASPSGLALTLPAARIIATMPARIGSGRPGHAEFTSCKSGSGVDVPGGVSGVEPSNVWHDFVQRFSETDIFSDEFGDVQRFAKPLYGFAPVSRVRIPPSPFFETVAVFSEGNGLFGVARIDDPC